MTAPTSTMIPAKIPNQGDHTPKPRMPPRPHIQPPSCLQQPASTGRPAVRARTLLWAAQFSAFASLTSCEPPILFSSYDFISSAVPNPDAHRNHALFLCYSI